MWDTMKGTVLDYSTLKATYGVEPERFIEVMGLSGDTGDNIPGVPGVGEKTALDLIKRFGSMEAVFDHLDTIPGKRLKENLVQSKDMARLSKELVTIDRFVPLAEGVEDLAVGEPDREGLAQIFRDMEFKGLWEQFTARETESVEYRSVLSLDVLRELVGRIRAAGMVCVDTETTSPDPLRAGLVGLSFTWEEGKAFYIPVGHSYWGVPAQISWTEAKGLLKDLLEDEEVLKVGQNIKYDAEVLGRHGVEMRGIHFDTMVASYVINPGLRQHNLDLLAQQYLNRKMIAYKDVVGRGKEAINFSEVPIQVATSYSCEDADITLRLTKVLGERLKADQNEQLFYDLEMKLIPVLMEMEISGIRIDSAFFQEMSGRFSQDINRMEREIYEEAGMEFNINSPQQLAFVLFERLQLPGMKRTTKTKQPSTDVKVLRTLAASPFKIPGLLLRYRTLTKLKSTYLDALVKLVHPETGRVHTSFNQTVTATGRLSSSNPNLQNIPVRGEEGREIRRGFVADGGNVLVSADYSQVELRIFAHYSEDKAFMEAFRRNEDIHTRTAGEILGMNPEDITPEKRRIAKAINFGIIYGMGPQKLSEQLGIELKVAKDYISTYYQRYAGVAQVQGGND